MHGNRSISRILIVAAAGLALLGGLGWLAGHHYDSVRHHYLLAHSTAELFSIVVAFSIFLIVWNSRGFWQNSCFLLLGVGYLCVAVLDLAHTLAYKGMGVFNIAGSNVATQLWVAGRYVNAAALLAAPLVMGRKVRAYPLLAGGGLLVVSLLALIFPLGVFPTCFADDGPVRGLTSFKYYSEYAVCAAFVAAGLLLWARRRRFDRAVAICVLGSISLTVISELLFTMYTDDPYGRVNLAGHVLKVLAFYLLYKAVIETALKKPYGMLFRELSQRQAILQQTAGDAGRRREETAALLAASRAVLEHKDFQTAAKGVFDAAKGLIGAVGGYVALLSKDGKGNEVLFLDSGGEECTVDPSLPMPVRGLRAEAYEARSGVYDNNFANSPYKHFLPEGHMLMRNVLFAPMVLDGKAVGLMGLANKPGGFTDGDLRLAIGFGELAAIALRNSMATESLANSESMFRAVAETASDAIVCADADGRIVLWNEGAERIFGYPAREAAGRYVGLMVPARFRASYAEAVSAAGDDSRSDSLPEVIELAGLRKSGGEFPIELSLASWRTKEGLFHTSIIRDVTRHKQAEDELRQAKTELEERVRERTADLDRTVDELQAEALDRLRAELALKASHDFLEIGYRHDQVGPLLEEFAVKVMELAKCDGVGIRVLDEEGRIPYRASVGFPKEFYDSESPLNLADHRCLCSNIVAGKATNEMPFFTQYGSFFCNGLSSFHGESLPGDQWQLRNVCCAFGYESMALVPIRYGSGTLGLVHMVHRQANRLPYERVELIERLAVHIGTALRRVMAEQRVERERQSLFSLLQDLPGYVVLTGEDYTIRFANDKFVEIFGQPLGRTCHQIMYGRGEPCELCAIESILAKRLPADWEQATSDGREFHVWGYPFEDIDGTRLVLQLGTDVTERKRLEREIVRISEEEKRSIGRDLHDSLGQTLGGISCLMQVLRRKLEGKKLKEAGEAAKIELLLSNAVGLTGALARGLNPIGLQPDGLLGAVQELASGLESMYGISCRVASDGPVEVADVVVAVHLYRIAQEAIGNAARHGRARNVDIWLASRGRAVELVVEDDGEGLPDDAENRGGLGLKIMRYRASAINALISLDKRPEGGTRLTCRQIARPHGSTHVDA